MKNNKEIRDWILENCVDYNGDIDLSNLDFSGFDGNVDISHMKVKKDLSQGNQEVGGSLWQNYQKVGEYLYNNNLKVKGYVYIGRSDFAAIKEWDKETRDWKIKKDK